MSNSGEAKRKEITTIQKNCKKTNLKTLKNGREALELITTGLCRGCIVSLVASIHPASSAQIHIFSKFVQNAT